MQQEGRILKGISSFYEVEAGEKLYTCKARGVFRKTGVTPLPGDFVRFTPGGEGEEGTVDAVLERRNSLMRPPVANLDYLFVVVSVCEPAPNALVIDRLTAIAEHKQIEPVLVVTKSDLGDPQPLCAVYRKAGFSTFCVGADERADVPRIRQMLCGHTAAFTGNSGVGKSTLLNALDPALSIATAQISRKLGRGRHTTRHVELYKTCGGYVADTPGFSALDIENGEFIHKDELQYCFRDFAPYLGECRFTSCAHVRDKGCRVLEAVQSGDVCASRHESYVALYEEARQIKDWEIR
ncbi:MAG: ribosome small subunit-dependent GTPase A [Clostridia bacterium]|nr:ribosome small subunit-dependent GTPase A [Clostridia bacterium]